MGKAQGRQGKDEGVWSNREVLGQGAREGPEIWSQDGLRLGVRDWRSRIRVFSSFWVMGRSLEDRGQNHIRVLGTQWDWGWAWRSEVKV